MANKWRPSNYVPGERYALGWRWHKRLCVECGLVRYTWAEPVLMTARQLASGKWQVWSKRVQLLPEVVMPPKNQGEPEIACSCLGKRGPRRNAAKFVKKLPRGRHTKTPTGERRVRKTRRHSGGVPSASLRHNSSSPFSPASGGLSSGFMTSRSRGLLGDNGHVLGDLPSSFDSDGELGYEQFDFDDC